MPLKNRCHLYRADKIELIKYIVKTNNNELISSVNYVSQ